MNDPADQAWLDAVGARFRGGDLAGARADCERFISATGDSRRQATARFWLGAIEAKSGSLEAAAGQFELALAASRRDPFWLLQAGLTYFQLGNRARAEQLYRDAIRLNPRMAVAHYNLGVLLQQKADFAGAKRAFEAALNHQPQFAEAHTNLANTLVALGNADRAEAHYREALATSPQLANAHYGLGLHHMRRQQHQQASHCFEAAVRCQPGHADAWLDLAECRHLAGQGDQAVACIDRVLAVEPHHAVARFKRSQFSGLQPDSAPRDWIERLYAGMAGSFDEHLTQRLGYRIPALLIEALSTWLSEFEQLRGRRPAVLDLGCGTGLFGIAVRPFADTLTGVDLSAAMLAKARDRGIYDALIENDLQSFLLATASAGPGDFDLVTATDVLIYVGSLNAVFSQVAARLLCGARFAFSTESPPDLETEYRLEASGRFVHSPAYIVRLASAAGFDVVKRIGTVVRTENARPLDGHLFILQKR